MARIRTIKPEFWQHPKVCRVSRDARLLFIGLLNEADDEGKMRWSPKRIAGVLFGEDDDVTARHIDKWIEDLELVGLVRRYEVDGASLLIVLGFTEHQSINRPSPSRLPDPVTLEDSLNTHGALTEGSVAEQGTGNREQGMESAHSAPPPTPSLNGAKPKPSRGCRIPDEFEVDEAMYAWASESAPGVDVDRETQKFVNYWSAQPGQRGVKLNWRATWQNWLLKAAEYQGALR